MKREPRQRADAPEPLSRLKKKRFQPTHLSPHLDGNHRWLRVCPRKTTRNCCRNKESHSQGKLTLRK
ncbi:unnamed protein product [Ixodes persulcatus]